MSVKARQADGAAALKLNQIHERLVDLARQHHERDADGFLVRDPNAVNKGALLAHFSEHLGDLRPAAVYQYDLDADQLQQADIADDGILQVLGDHGVAAVFDDDDLAAVVLNIRQGVNQNSGPLCICDIHTDSSCYVR